MWNKIDSNLKLVYFINDFYRYFFNYFMAVYLFLKSSFTIWILWKMTKKKNYNNIPCEKIFLFRGRKKEILRNSLKRIGKDFLLGGGHVVSKFRVWCSRCACVLDENQNGRLNTSCQFLKKLNLSFRSSYENISRTKCLMNLQHGRYDK